MPLISTDQGKSYPASAWTPETGEECVSGSLYVKQFSVCFEGEETKLEFPFEELEIVADEQDKEKIYFLHPRAPNSGIYTYEGELADHPKLRQRTNLRNQLEQLKYRREGPTKHDRRVFAVLTGVVLLLGLLWFGNNAIIGIIVNRIPDSVEEDIGRKVMAEVKEEFEYVTDPAYTNYLDAVARRLVSALPRSGVKYKFYIVDEEGINAFAVPGGHLVVFRGLIDAAESPEEVAAVLAHEIAHTTERHVLRQMTAQAGPFVAFNYFLGGRGSFLTGLAAAASFLGGQKYSREHETDADDLGFEYLVKAEINPRGAVDLFKRLDEAEGGMSATAAFLRSHPPTPERVRRMEKKLSKTGSKRWKPFTGLEKPEPRAPRRRGFFP